MTPNWTAEVSLHEAAHCVAMYLEGLKIDKVRVSKTDGSVTSASKKPMDDPFAHAVSLLAGNAFMRSLGKTDDGESPDFVRASFLVAEQFLDHPGAAKEAFAIVCEATNALVRTPRFVELVTALAPILAKSYLHLGSEVERFLGERDPERPSIERQSVGPRVKFIRHPIGPDHNPDCVVCKAYPPAEADWAAGENRGYAGATLAGTEA